MAPGQWQFGGKIQEGFIIAHRSSIVHLQKEHVKGIEIDRLWQTDGSANWHHLYNFPLIGFGYQFFYLGNKEELGNGQCITGLIHFPILKNKRMRLNYKLGLGIGYVDKPFNLTDNYKNLIIGSHFNAAITTGLQYRFRSNRYNQFYTGIDFTHFSNGASKVPNLGINITTANIGFMHCFGKDTQLKRDTNAITKNKNETTFLVAFGAKELYPPKNAVYGVVIFTGDRNYRVSQKSKLGAGTDFFIDNSTPAKLFGDSIFISGFKSMARGGIHVSYGLEIGRCSGYIQTGYYVYTKVKSDGNIYSQLSIRYLFTKHLFACFNLKTHYARADYFQYGIGYKI